MYFMRDTNGELVLPLSCRWHYVEQRACPEQGWCVAVNYW